MIVLDKPAAARVCDQAVMETINELPASILSAKYRLNHFLPLQLWHTGGFC